MTLNWFLAGHLVGQLLQSPLIFVLQQQQQIPAGSIRQPAAFTGTVGLKPTYGRVSRWGTIAFASSLDQAGPITRTVEDAAIMLQAMASHDEKDTTSVDIAVPDYRKELAGKVKGMTIGIPKEYRVDGMSEEIEALWQQGIEWFKDAGG